eukprot:7020451-Pyramimonas_sp.AAC.1
MKLMLIQPLDEMRAKRAAVAPAVAVDDAVLQRWGGSDRVAEDPAADARAGRWSRRSQRRS